MNHFVITPILLIFILLFLRWFWRQIIQSSFDLVELVLLTTLTGHGFALPLWVIQTHFDPLWRFHSNLIVLGQTGIALGMAGGGFWVLNRLSLLEEYRRGVRIMYLIFGMFMFPSLVAWIPFMYHTSEAEKVLLLVMWPMLWYPLWHVLSDLNREALSIPEQQDCVFLLRSGSYKGLRIFGTNHR